MPDETAVLFEVIGGPLEGGVEELLPWVADAARRGDVVILGGYRVAWWAQRDAAGREIWRRECLVWQP